MKLCLKRLVAMLLSIMMVVSMLPTAAFAAQMDDAADVVIDTNNDTSDSVELLDSDVDADVEQTVTTQTDSTSGDAAETITIDEDTAVTEFVENETAYLVGEGGYASLDDALAAAKADGVSEVEITVAEDIEFSTAVKDFTKVTFTGSNRAQTVDMNLDAALDIGTELVFNDLTVSRLDAEWLYHYTYIRGGLTYNDCKMVGLFNVTAQDTDFIGCDFYNDDTFGNGNYSLWLYNCLDGVEVNVTDCTFDVYERAVKIWADGYSGVMTLNVTGTEFTSRTADKTVVEMAYANSTGVGAMELNIVDSTATGFGAPEHIEGEANAWFNVESTDETETVSTVSVDDEVVYTDVEAVVPTGSITLAYTDPDYYDSGIPAIYGEASGNAAESFVIKLYSGSTLVATTQLNHIDEFNGAQNVTWHAALSDDGDGYWTTIWEANQPNVNTMPDKVALYVDGTKVAENSVVLYRPDEYGYVVAAQTDSTGKITAYFAADGYWSDNAENNTAALKAAVNAGGNIVLLRDVALSGTTMDISKSVTIDGNGHKLTLAEGFAANASNAMLDIMGGATVSFKNLTFDGIKDAAVMRTVDANVVIDHCVIQNCVHTASQGLLRLACGNAAITNSKFLDNSCTMVVSFGYDSANDTDVLTVNNCEFKGNTCGETAVVYFADGGDAAVTNTKFVDNTVSAAGNAATLYMGWGTGYEVSGCLFEGNSVTSTHTTTERLASAVFCDGCEVTGNVFKDNTATRGDGTAAPTVAVAGYYGPADVSGNYWDGGEPDYTHEYETRNEVTNTSYYTDYTTDDNGNVVLSESDKVVIAASGLSGTGTEADPYLIADLEDLKWFRDDVNAGNTYDGQYIKLDAEIDLGSEAWTPIGNSTNKFLGSFDGDNHTISNLVVDVETNNAGLFGFASVVKNVKIKNAAVSGIVCVGALVGELESSVGTVENCHVSGTIQITGENSVGGLVGKGYANIENSSVDGGNASDSFVKGVAGATEEGDNVGGIQGHLGEGNTLGVADSAVKNITVIGTRKVGGIVGTTARANDITGCTVDGVVIESTATAEYADANASTTTIGGIVGNYFGTATSGGILKDSTVKDVTFNIGNAKSAGILAGGDRANNGGAPVGVAASGITVSNVTGATNTYLFAAEVDGVYFTDLQEAIKAAAPAGTVEILADTTVDEWVMIAESLSIGNGNIITLAINGLSINGNGHTLAINSIESAGNGGYLFYDAQNLTVQDLTVKYADGLVGGICLKSGTIKNVTFDGGTYAVLPGEGTVSVEGCTFKTNGTAIYYEAARDNLSVTGNTFEQAEGKYAITIRGGTTFTDNEVISGKVTVASNATGTISGNNFNDQRFKVYNAATASITGNTINNLVFNDETATAATFTDNTLSAEAQAALAAVTPITIYVAQIGDVKYETLAKALTAAEDGDTIELLWTEGDAPIAMNGAVYGKTVTITGTATVDWSKGWLFVGRGGEGDGKLIFSNAQLTAAANGGRDIGIHVSGATSDTTKNDGMLEITGGSNIELDWLVNRNEVTVDGNSTLTVVAGLNTHGRNAEESDSGEAQTATLTVKDGSVLTLKKYDTVIGNESYGILNIEGTVNAPNMTVNANGTVNVTGGTLNVTDTLTTNKNLFVSGDSVVKIENLNGRATILDDTTLTDSYIKSTTNGTTRVLGDLTLNGGFGAAYFMTAGSATSTSDYEGTITIADDTTLHASYGVELNGDVSLNGGTIELSGGNASGSIWGFVMQSGAFDVNTDIVVDGGSDATPIHFTNADATINSSISQSKSGGEPVYISYGSEVNVSETGSVTTDCAVFVNANSALKSSGDITGTIKANADTATIEISGGTYTQDISEWCVDGCIVIDNGDGTYGVAAPVEVDTYEELVALFTKDSDRKPVNAILTADITGTAAESSGYGKAGIVLNAGDVLNGDGHTLRINGANGTWDCVIAMKGGTVKNLTIAGAFRGVFMPGANGDVLIDNCVFKDVIYTFNSDGGSKDYAVTIKNTTLNGWTSYSNVHKSVTFDTCTFGEGSGYAYFRPYQATTFNNCEFAEGYEIATNKTAENSLALNDCTYAGEAISADNGSDLFGDSGKVMLNGESVDFTRVAAITKDGVTTKYATLQTAIDAAETGETVELLCDVVLNARVDVKTVVTLDLNGKKITPAVDFPKQYLISVKIGGDLTINDSVGGGEINYNEDSSVYAAVGIVPVDGTAKLTVNGGKLVGYYYGIAGNGSADGSTITINGGEIASVEGTGSAIFHPQSGTLSVNGGTITGATGIYVKSGALNISGGTITGVGAKADYDYVAGADNATGDALVIENVGGETGYEAVSSVSITGGSFTSVNANAVGSYTAGNEGVEVKTGFIAGGTYSDVSAANYLADGYEMTVSFVNGEVVYGVKLSDAAYVASVNGTRYTNLQEAVNAANGKTVYLLGDVTLTETVTVSADATVTLDLNGHEITTTSYEATSTKDSSKTITKYLFAIDNKGTLSVQDSSADADGEIASRGIYNYGTLTLNSGTIASCDGSGGHAIDNYGTFVMNGGTVCTTYDDDPAGSSAYGTGYVSGDPSALRIRANASATLNGGVINSVCNMGYGISISSGTLTVPETSTVKVTGIHGAIVTDGTTTVNVAAGEFVCTGAQATGGSYVIDTWGGDTMTITGGTFTAKLSEGFTPVHEDDDNVSVLYVYVNDAGEISNDVAISGGTFSEGETISGYLASGYQVVENADGTYGVTEDPCAITSLEDLKAFRDAVNSGSTYGDQPARTGSFYLAADIDLLGEEWTPIGTNDSSFQGHFDGKGYTISNLVITGNNSKVGLFGRTNNNGSISNLTLHNAKVSGRLEVGTLVGTPSTFDYTNIKLTGHVEVNGFAYVGGVGGKNAYGDWTNITVDVDETSYVKATSTENGTAYRTYVGGVIGFNGEGGQTYKDITSNIDVIGDVCDIGGIFGIAHYGNNFVNITCTGNVTNTVSSANDGDDAAADVLQTGLIAGVWHNKAGYDVEFTGVFATGTISAPNVEGVVFENGGLIGGAYSAENDTSDTSGSLVVDGTQKWPLAAKIGETYYASLTEAVAAVPTDGTETTITILSDVDLTATVKIEAGKNVTIDLNGKVIDGTENCNIALMSYGDLTIKDSSEDQSGAIKAGKSAGKSGNTINVCGGTFTLESGSIYSVNNAILVDEQAATININGGTITAEPSTDNSAVMYVSSTSDTAINITGGTMTGYNGILLWNNTDINMTGGSIDAKGSLGIQGNGSKDNTEISISGTASVSGYYAAIYHPQGGKLTITDNAALTGWSGVVVKGGEVTISGGTITATGAAADYYPVSSGFVDTGDALYVEHYDNSASSENYGTPVVSVTGGTFVSANGFAIGNYVNTNNAGIGVAELEKYVSGGSFTGAKEMSSTIAAEGYVFSAFEAGVAQNVVVDITANEAVIGSTPYKTLAEALAAVKEGETITLLNDVTISESIIVTADLTIDGNGKTLTYTGQSRAITVESGVDADLTVKNLTVDCAASYCQRGINYNTNGTLTLDNVSVKGANVTYAVNLPGSSDGATVNITDSDISGHIALNIWGENSVITVTDTALTSVDESEAENYAALKLNSDGTTSAEGTTVTVTGGSITALDENDEPSSAVTNGTSTGEITISDTTVVTGNINEIVAVVRYEGSTDYYGCYTLQAAIDKASESPIASVVLVKDIELTESVRVTGIVTVDLNGRILTGPDDGKANWYAFIVDGGELTLKDKVGTGELYAKCYGVETKSGSFTMESGKITATRNGTVGTAIVNYGGTVTVKGGTLSGALDAVHTGGYYANAVTNIEGGTMNGTVYVWDYSDEYTETVTSTSDSYAVVDGFEWVKNGDVYVLAAITYVAQLGETQYATLQEAVDIGGEIVVLTDLSERVTIPDGKTVAIDLGNHTLTGSILAPNATLTIENGSIANTDKSVSAIEINAGTLTLTDVNIDGARHAVRIDGAVTATIDGGTYRSAIGEGTGTYHAVNVSGAANVTIESGTFTGPKGTTADSGAAVNVQTGATVTIEGGSFSKGLNNTLAAEGTLSVKGGTYDQDPAAYVAEGYAACYNADVSGYVAGKLPEAEVSSLTEDGALTLKAGEYNVYTGGLNAGTADLSLPVALQFTAKDTAEAAKANAFGYWNTDFYISMTGVEGEIDLTGCYLAGHYGTWGWIAIPLDGVQIEGDTVYPVLGAMQSDWFEYWEICADVQQFKCGIYLTDAVLEAYPELKVNLELRIAPHTIAAGTENTNYIQIGDTYTYDIDDLTEKEELVDAELKTYLQALSLQEYVGMQFIVLNSATTGYDRVYAVVEREDGATELAGTATSNYIKFEVPILAAEMSEEVTFTLYGEKDGKTYKGESLTKSVRSLSAEKFTAANDATKKVIVDMLNYGAAVQTQFSLNADDLANKNLTAEQLAYGSQSNPSTEGTLSETGSGTVVFRAKSLSLQEKVEFSLVLMLADAAKADYEVRITVNGETTTVDGAELVRFNDSFVRLNVAVKATDLREVYEIAVYEKETDMQVSPTLTMDVAGLAKSKLDADLDAVIYAMLNYGDSAAAL